MGLTEQMQAQCAAAAKADAEYILAVEVVGEETAKACLAWAQSTIIPNTDAFGICWRSGGPHHAERPPAYREDMRYQLRRISRIDRPLGPLRAGRVTEKI